jgi:hypothetical protein
LQDCKTFWMNKKSKTDNGIHQLGLSCYTIQPEENVHSYMTA